MVTVHTAMGDIVVSDASPRSVAQLRRHAEIFRDLPQCRELSDHPRYGRQTCLTVLNTRTGACANAHRHVSTA